MKELIERCYLNPEQLSDRELVQLLSIDCHSDELYHLLSASNRLSRKKFANRGYVFVQMGLNAEPCSGDCSFCSLGSSHYSAQGRWHKTKEEVLEEVATITRERVDDLFLMCTADYSLEEYIEVVRAVKPLLRPEVRLSANIGDFNLTEALRLKEAGITGVYHVNRLREGIDTAIEPEQREATLQAIREAQLELYYCIEPIGAEHSYEELVVEIRRAQRLKPEVMAVMRRVSVEATPMANRASISALELTKIAAVTNLVVRPSRAMNLHETEQMSLLGGVNQLYAEFGANPRDRASHTEQGRGLSVRRARELLQEGGYRDDQSICRQG